MSDDSVKVSIIANVQGLLDGLKTATSGVKDASTKMQGSFKGIESMITNLKAPFLALAGVVAGGAIFKEVMNTTKEWTMEVNKLSKILNVNVQDASAWGVALHTLGVSGEDVTTIVGKLQARLATNGDAFQRWGVQTKDARGGALPMGQVIENMATKYQELNTGQEKNTMLQALGGRGWLALLPVMRLTTERMEEARIEAEHLHLVVGPEGVAKTREYQESMRKLDLIQKSLQIQIGNALMPTLTKLGAWLGQTGPGMATGMAVAIKLLITVFFALKAAIEITVVQGYTLITGLWDLAKNLVTALYQFNNLDFRGAWNTLKGGWTELKNDVLSGVDGIKTAITGAIKSSKDLWADEKASPGKPEGVNPILPGKDGKDPKATDGGESASLIDEQKWEADYLKKQEAARKKIEEANKRSEEEKARLAERLAAIDRAIGQNARDAQLSEIEIQEELTQQAAESGALGRTKELQRLKAYENQRYKIMLDEAKREAELEPDPAKHQVLLNKIAQVERQHALAVTKLNGQVAKQTTDRYQAVFSAVTSGFQSSISGLIKGTMTWGAAIKNIFASALDSMVGFFTEWGLQELKTIWMTAAAHKAASTEKVTENAAEAGSAGMKSAAEIPGYGWAIAIAAGLAIYAAASSLSSAAGGWDRVPSDQLAMIHKDEMVLPAHLAEGARQMFAGGGGGGDVHLHVHALDAKSFDGYLKANQGTLARTLKEMHRNGRRS